MRLRSALYYVFSAKQPGQMPVVGAGYKKAVRIMKRDAGEPAEEFFQKFFAEKGISKRK